MEYLGIAGFIFAATTAGALVHERESDVLHGPYIEGRMRQRLSAPMFDRMRPIVTTVMERLNWRARDAVYLAAMA